MRKATLLIPALMLVVAACSTGATASPAASVPAATSAAPATSAPASSAPASPDLSGTINLAETDLGTIVVDGEGKTLYIFTNDLNGTSTCYDQCAANWPALTATGEVTGGTGIDASDLATVDRTDGTKQVTYFGKPLYYFANDSAPGDVNGQGVVEKWYVIGADGIEIK